MTSPTCLIDGCTRPSDARRMCATHYKRWQRTGNPGPTEIRDYGHFPEPRPDFKGLMSWYR